MKLPYIFRGLGICTIAVALPAAPALSHPGALDADGCHVNRKTGDYHCHRGGISSARGAVQSRSYGVTGRFSTGAGLR